MKLLLDSEINREVNFHVVGHIKNPILKKDTDNLKFYGYKNKNEIAEFLKSADLLIAPYEKLVYDNAGNEITSLMSPLKNI